MPVKGSVDHLRTPERAAERTLSPPSTGKKNLHRAAHDSSAAHEDHSSDDETRDKLSPLPTSLSLPRSSSWLDAQSPRQKDPAAAPCSHGAGASPKFRNTAASSTSVARGVHGDDPHPPEMMKRVSTSDMALLDPRLHPDDTISSIIGPDEDDQDFQTDVYTLAAQSPFELHSRSDFLIQKICG